MQTSGSFVEKERTLGPVTLVCFCITAHCLLKKLQWFFLSPEAFAVVFHTPLSWSHRKNHWCKHRALLCVAELLQFCCASRALGLLGAGFFSYKGPQDRNVGECYALVTVSSSCWSPAAFGELGSLPDDREVLFYDCKAIRGKEYVRWRGNCS